MDKTAMDIRTVRSQLVDKGLVFFCPCHAGGDAPVYQPLF